MRDNLDDLVKYLTPMLNKLSDTEMTKLNKKVGADLRKSQQRRIAAQVGPDGSSFAPRRLREGKRIRRKMFTKLRSQRYFRNFSNAEMVSVGFLSNVVFVARSTKMVYVPVSVKMGHPLPIPNVNCWGLLQLIFK